MAKNCLDVLKERGFFQQCTNEEGLAELMNKESVTFYVGCDPTGPSLHIGHMVPFFALRHLRDAGHRGLALIGGGTARIGDPSGKTELRKMITYDQIDGNVERIKAQLDRFLDFSKGNVLAVNNKDWLADLNYIDFLRDIGSCFSVNRMLTFEAYKKRMETGLSFLEFNYQLLQSYDYLCLHEKYGCSLQIGGDDQWGNMVAGVDLIRRKLGNERNAFALTFPLITRSDGQKMGKTEKGALFLDPELTSVYDFFQYWRNVSDADVRKFMLLFTFLPVAEIDAICAGDINQAKERLALEVTAEIHGRDEANKALEGAKAAFGGGGNIEMMPTTAISQGRLDAGVGILDLMVECELAGSKGEIRRLIGQGGCKINGEKITDDKLVVTSEHLTDKGIILAVGKKKMHRITAE